MYKSLIQLLRVRELLFSMLGLRVLDLRTLFGVRERSSVPTRIGDT